MIRTTLSILAVLVATVRLQAAPQYNLVAIVTDDQAAWTLGCYGGKEIPTPNLDKLAASGTRFANAFVHTPVCSPSRGTYMTGLQSTQLGFTDWLNEGQMKNGGLTKEMTTWPAVLRTQGVATGLIGKWHLGLSEQSLPWNQGLAEYTGFLGGGWAPNKVNFVDEKGGKHALPGFSVEVCTDLAIKFTTAHKDKPFALLVHYREPHAAYVPMPATDMESSRQANLQVPDFPGLKQPHTTNNRRDYYASIAALDRNIGRLLDHLKASGLDGKTIVTFTSDHGYNVGEHGIQHKGNGRWITEDRFQQPAPNMYDSTIRVPLIIHHPATTKPGHVAREWVTNADTAATMLGLLGITRPATLPAASRDISPAARGEALDASQFPEELFGQYDLVNFELKNNMRMIRTARWKLLLHLNDPARNELYDLTADPGERTNLIGKPGNESTIADLTKLLRARMERIKDPKLPLLP